MTRCLGMDKEISGEQEAKVYLKEYMGWTNTW